MPLGLACPDASAMAVLAQFAFAHCMTVPWPPLVQYRFVASTTTAVDWVAPPSADQSVVGPASQPPSAHSMSDPDA